MAVGIEVLQSFPDADEAAAERLLQEELKKNRRKLVVLDDDPTGVQTVHDVAVYTDWQEETILRAFLEEEPMFFVLTNSRGFTREETRAAHHQIAKAVAKAAAETKKEYLLVSRSDSTLRGHYPLETEILKEEIEAREGFLVDGEILCPCFFEGGRFTLGNVHYVREGENLTPVHETEFAKDQTFGFHAPSLPEYVEEKTRGRYAKEEVICISIEELRSMDLGAVEKKLLQAEHFRKIIVNAVSYGDLQIFAAALYRAMDQGKHFLFRTAASLVRVLGGIAEQPLLTRERLGMERGQTGGLILAGSHTAKTTAQLERLREIPGIEFLELDVSLAEEEAAFEEAVNACAKREEEAISRGRTVCCYTSRKLCTAHSQDKEDHLRLSVKISDAVQSLAGRLKVKPAFVVAKGGITSSDVGTKALGVKKALVLGQIQPGVPVWKTGPESRFPGIPYVIFPGNVGQEDTLKRAVEILIGEGETDEF